MYQIRRRLRTAIRPAACVAAVAGMLCLGLAIGAPLLVSGDSVRRSLVQQLTAWSGGKVEITGRVKLASLFALTIEAEKVRLTNTAGLDPVERIDARSVKAIVGFGGLLRGRVEVEKLVVSSANVFLRQDLASAVRLKEFPLDLLTLPVALADRGPFRELILRQAHVLPASGTEAPYQNMLLPQVKLSRFGPGDLAFEGQLRRNGERLQLSARMKPGEANGSSIVASVVGDGVEAGFRGALDAAKASVAGSLSLKLAASSSLAAMIAAALQAPDAAGALSMQGSLSWSQGHLLLESATVGFGDRVAKGSVELIAGDRIHLVATLAYDSLSAESLFEAVTNRSNSSSPASVRHGPAVMPDIDFDMRLSADRVEGGSIAAGPLAVAFSTEDGRVSADLAELGLLGGTISGRVDYDPRSSSLLTVKAAGRRLDAASLARALALPAAVDGAADLTLDLTAPEGPPAVMLAAAKGHFTLKLPQGAVLSAGLSREFGAVLANWDGGRVHSPLRMSRLEMDGLLSRDAISATVGGDSDSMRFSGSLQFGIPGATVSGHLSVAEIPEADASEERNETAAEGQPPPATVLVSGTAEAPRFAVAATGLKLSN